MSERMLLRALDGSNPLGFLAALGTLRLLHLSKPDAGVRMCWERSGGFWRPKLLIPAKDEDELCELLINAPWAPVDRFKQIGENITVPRESFASFVEQAHVSATRQERRAADFAAAFGCEICEDKEKGRIQYTDFCFITGSGRQDFLGTIGKLAKQVTAKHLHDALFSEWRRENITSMSMRWDPSDAAEYALRWSDPSKDGAWTVPGANRLAAEALPYFPAMPVNRRLRTTGFKRGKRTHEFTWPIWSQPVGFDTVRSLMSLAELQENTPNRETLRGMGIDEVYRAQRVRIPPNGPQYKVSFRPARAV